MLFKILAFVGLLAAMPAARAAEVVIHFDNAEIGKAVPAYTNSGVVFAPAHGTTRSSAAARVMFFPHVTGKTNDTRGILNAMADDPIPVKISFPNGAVSVSLVMWGSGPSGTGAVVEAFDQDGKVVDKAALDTIPVRKSPGEPQPFFELSVKAPAIAYVCFSGPRTGEFLAAKEVRFTPLPEPAK
jgi:hypothetical protein